MKNKKMYFTKQKKTNTIDTRNTNLNTKDMKMALFDAYITYETLKKDQLELLKSTPRHISLNDKNASLISTASQLLKTTPIHFVNTLIQNDLEVAIEFHRLKKEIKDFIEEEPPRVKEVKPRGSYGKFEIFKDREDRYRFRIKAPNGEVIATSEGYNSKQACMDGIISIKKNVLKAEIEIKA